VKPGVRSLSVILPAFNEAPNIEKAVSASADACTRLGLDYEIVIVDDGSHDATGELGLRLAAADPHVRLYRHPRNRGYGAALRTGIEEACKEHIFFTDADLQFDMTDLGLLLEKADHFDIIAGYRSPRADSWHRRLYAWGWGRTVGLAFGLQVRDIDCAFKLFHRRVFETVPIRAIGAFVNSEILVRARAAGFSIAEVPVRHFPRQAGVPTGGNPRVILRALLELARLHRELSGLPTPARLEDLTVRGNAIRNGGIKEARKMLAAEARNNGGRSQGSQESLART
jgi:glycosyltransferase involved in cell wall biosynthesis